MGGIAVAANDGSTNTASATGSILLDVARLAIVDFMKDWELLASIAFVEPERIVNAAAIVVGLGVLRCDLNIVVAIIVGLYQFRRSLFRRGASVHYVRWDSCRPHVIEKVMSGKGNECEIRCIYLGVEGYSSLKRK